MGMKILCLFLIGVFTISCSSLVSEKATQIRHDPVPTYTAVNMGRQFEKFWRDAESKPFDQQMKIWDAVVEKPNQDLFDSLVYSKRYSKDWATKKEKRLREYFAELPMTFDSQLKIFDSFETTLADQIKKYSKKFPDSKFANKIYAVPGASFNGKSGELSQSKETVLAFGINIMLKIEDDPDVLYSHELFHIYHNNRLNIDSKTYDEKGKMTLPLWMEGLAVYVSREMNPLVSDDKILMSKDLPRVSHKDIKWLAQEFLKVADSKSFDEAKPEVYQNWFTYGRQIRSDIPTRAGYLLGYHVAKEHGKHNSSYEMAGWNLDQIHTKVKEALVSIAK